MNLQAEILACAAALKLKARVVSGRVRVTSPPATWGTTTYDPLHDDAQAMELVKVLRLTVEPLTDGEWQVSQGGHWGHCEDGKDLNETIVRCVAKLAQPPSQRNEGSGR